MLVTNHPKGTLPTTHTTTPIINGSSVIALKYNGGVIIGCDCQMTFGSGLTKFFNVQRISPINNNTLFTSSGELSDFQVLNLQLQQLQQQNDLQNDGNTLTPQNYLSYLSFSQYQQRNKFNPYMISGVIAGPNFLGFTDMFGTKLETDYVVTGMAPYICRPIISSYWNPQCSEQQAREVLIECFKVLHYRHTRGGDIIQFGVVDQNGTRIEEPFKLQTKWDHKAYLEAASEKMHRK